MRKFLWRLFNRPENQAQLFLSILNFPCTLQRLLISSKFYSFHHLIRIRSQVTSLHKFWHFLTIPPKLQKLLSPVKAFVFPCFATLLLRDVTCELFFPTFIHTFTQILTENSKADDSIESFLCWGWKLKRFCDLLGMWTGSKTWYEWFRSSSNSNSIQPQNSTKNFSRILFKINKRAKTSRNLQLKYYNQKNYYK